MVQQIRVPVTLYASPILPTIITVGVLYATKRLSFVAEVFDGVRFTEERLQLFPNIEVVLDFMLLVAGVIWIGSFALLTYAKRRSVKNALDR